MSKLFFARRLQVLLVVLILLNCISLVQAQNKSDKHWFKGNLHTHSLWSDGDQYPEMIVDWYKSHGYDFLAMSDHNTLQEGERWTITESNKAGAEGLRGYIKRFGTNWVEQRGTNETNEVRLKTYPEFRGLFEETNKFLLVLAEEITDRHLAAPIHLNVSNIREVIKPQGGTSVFDVIQNNVNAVLEQRTRTGQPMFLHLNHPNFGWGVTAEDLLSVKGERFFEVYNGHPSVHNEGDAIHASTERIWDILLTKRLTELHLDPVFGLGTDDAHHYHEFQAEKSNPGRGWIMVHATDLSAKSLINAMEAGEFYATSGVLLKKVERGPKSYSIQVEPEPGVTYTTQFIGTRKGFDPKSEPVASASGTPLRVTHRYSKDIGVVLAEVKGDSAQYKLKGDEVYVRARITSSKLKANGSITGEVERAWTQPLVKEGR